MHARKRVNLKIFIKSNQHENNQTRAYESINYFSITLITQNSKYYIKWNRSYTLQ